MGTVVPFPSIQPGKNVALYTQNFIYSGTASAPEDMAGEPAIWLDQAMIYPIAGQVTVDEVLRVPSVCVLWRQVVAFGPATDLDVAPSAVT